MVEMRQTYEHSLTSQAETIVPHPASTESFMRTTFAASGGMHITIATKVRLSGKIQQSATPIQRKSICTAPDGAVYSIVSYSS